MLFDEETKGGASCAALHTRRRSCEVFPKGAALSGEQDQEVQEVGHQEIRQSLKERKGSPGRNPLPKQGSGEGSFT